MRDYLLAFCAALIVHALAAAAAGWLARTPRTEPRRESPRAAIVAFIVAPEDSRFPGLNPVPDTGDDWFPPLAAIARVSKHTFTFDVARIAERAQVLFPFLTPGLAWDHFARLPDPIVAGGLANPLSGRGSRHERAVAARALSADDAAMQRLVDESWSRRKRWSAFARIRHLAETYSGDVGQLPQLLQRYCDQNSLQPYSDATIRDPRLWAQLTIAAEHVDFIGFIRRYTADHPGSKAATALLFLLDNMVQASRDALDALLEGDPVHHLVWTREATPRGYELIAQLRRHYTRDLDRRGLTSTEAIDLHYDTVRLGILTRIVRTTSGGYRANDARFLIGTIYWRQQRFQDALRAWRDMSVDSRDSYVGAYSRILDVLQNGHGRTSDETGGIDPALHRAVRQILKNERARWLAFSYDRLRRFGYRFDTF